MSYADSPHKVGPPYRANAPTFTRSTRFTEEELEALEHHAEQHGTTAAAIVRAGLKKAGLFGRRRVALDL